MFEVFGGKFGQEREELQEFNLVPTKKRNYGLILCRINERTINSHECMKKRP